MKLWRFFRIPANYTNNKMKVRDKFPLCAITNKKKYMKIFKESRDVKNNFIMRCDEVDKKEGIQYMHDNRGQVLNFYKLRTYPTKSLSKHKDIKVLMSDFDRRALEEVEDSYAVLMDITPINPDIFNISIEKFLYDIGYIDFYSLSTSEIVNGYEMDSYPSLDYETDELLLFLKIHIDDLTDISKAFKYD